MDEYDVVVVGAGPGRTGQRFHALRSTGLRHLLLEAGGGAVASDQR